MVGIRSRVIMGEMPHGERHRTFGISGLSGIKYSSVDFIRFRLLVRVTLVSETVFPLQGEGRVW